MQQQTVSFAGALWQVYVRDEADRSIFAEIFKLREYRAAEEVIKEALDPIIDVGAHSGLFSLYVRALNSIVPIIAIEPEKNNIKLLQKHFKENNISLVTIFTGALAGEAGRRKLALSGDSHAHRLLDISPAEESNAIEIVPAISLPGLFKKYALERISLIKMDIEGAEYEIFENLDNEDFLKIGAIIMEYHNYDSHHYSEIEKKLRQNGFGVQIFPSKFDKRMGFIFAKNKRK